MTKDKTTRKPWSRGKKWGVLAGVPLALIALPAAAAVIIAALAGITGGGSTGSYTAKFKGSVATDTSNLVVKPSNVTVVNGKLKLPADLVMFPGESFTITATVNDEGSTAPGWVSGITMPGMPSNYTAELVSGCGGNFPLYDSQEVRIKVTAAETQTPGQSWTLAPEAGVQVSVGEVPAGATCEVYTAP
ncbi:hypothetical protein V8Z69_18350 [Microbacterium aurugineum]|uniref:hypothetical protein n=1 Tax=Microbacterium aurugineum TaxID=2851642 RepID=UPI0039BDFAE7